MKAKSKCVDCGKITEDFKCKDCGLVLCRECDEKRGLFFSQCGGCLAPICHDCEIEINETYFCNDCTHKETAERMHSNKAISR